MALARIAMPEIRQEGPSSNAAAIQKDPVIEVAAADWLPNTLVFTSGTGASVVLNPVATAGTTVMGLCPDQSRGTTARPPDSLFGGYHYPFDLRGRILEINIGTAVVANFGVLGTGVTWAGGGTGGVVLAPGQQYGITRSTTGTYNKYQWLDVSNTTQKLFEIVALAPNQSVNDTNPRVWVKLIDAILQG